MCLCLRSEGQVVYHGPREQVMPFFNSLGFTLPPRKGVADFLQEVTSRRDQQQFWARDPAQYRFLPITEIHQAYLDSTQGKAQLQALAAPAPVLPEHLDPLVRKKVRPALCVLLVGSVVPLVLATLGTSQLSPAHCEAALCPADKTWFSTWLKPALLHVLTCLQYALGPWGNFKALLRRDWTLMRRNKFLYT